VLDESTWKYAGNDSASLAWETNLPATAYVEYGPTTSYGSKTPVSDRATYIHVIHLAGLKSGTGYHYRLVATDERGRKFSPRMRPSRRASQLAM